MSASEKLKALVETQDIFPHVQIVEGEMRRALPQIIAVVEAAEALVPTKHYEIIGPYEYVRGDELYAARVALAALDEALA